MEEQTDRFIAVANQTAFEQQHQPVDEEGHSGYRHALSQRMGLGETSVFVHGQQTSSASENDMRPPLNWGFRTPSPPPQPEADVSTPSQRVPPYDAFASPFSPPDTTPGEFNNGNTTPRKQTAGNFTPFGGNTRSPFHTPTQSLPSPSPMMRTPVQRIDGQSYPSPFQSPQQPMHRPSTPQMQMGALPPTTGSHFVSSITRSPQPTPSNRRRDGTTPSKILDAKGIIDDFDASHVLAWGRHFLIIGLQNVAYMWSPTEVTTLFEAHCDITAVACSAADDPDDYIAVGLSNGLIHHFLVVTPDNIKPCPQLREHCNVKVSSLALHRHTLYSTTSDGTLSILDLHTHGSWRRTLDTPILSVAVTADGNHVALGTNDGVTVFHSSNLANPTTVYDSEIPVRAVSWAPYCDVGTLAFTSGRNNSEVVVFSLGSGVKATCDVGAEVCSLLWTPSSEIIACCGDENTTRRSRPVTPLPSGHGTSLANSISILEMSADRLKRVALIDGHQSRVLHAALSWDGDTLVTGAGGMDATVRFWNIPAPAQPLPFSNGLPSRIATPPVTVPLFEDEFR